MTNAISEKQPFLVILDEYPYHNPYADDNLKAELRAIDGVPNATYVVNDNKVFVFNLLVKLVKAEPGFSELQGEDRREFVRTLVPRASVSPDVAVSQWAVVPEPYQVREVESKFEIFHPPFGARIPQLYATQAELNDALSFLLIGGIIKGTEKPTFMDGGQPLKSVESFSLASLPSAPAIWADALAEVQQSTHDMAGHTFHDSFPLLNASQFSKIVSLQGAWRDLTSKALVEVEESRKIWSMVAKFPLAELNGPEVTFLPDPADSSNWKSQWEMVNQLRSYYSELTALNDASIYEQFDNYQTDCTMIRRWDARDVRRNSDFYYYLIGLVTGKGKATGMEAKELGAMTVFFMLQDADMDQAGERAMAWLAYNQSIGQLYHRAISAMHFLNVRQTAKPYEVSHR